MSEILNGDSRRVLLIVVSVLERDVYDTVILMGGDLIEDSVPVAAGTEGDGRGAVVAVV